MLTWGWYFFKLLIGYYKEKGRRCYKTESNQFTEIEKPQYFHFSQIRFREIKEKFPNIFLKITLMTMPVLEKKLKRKPIIELAKHDGSDALPMP